MTTAFMYDEGLHCASQFTSKERDTETGLDYFGARYYGSSIGRWLSPDWSGKVEAIPYVKLDNPQTLNLFAYVLNNPVGTVDADGHDGNICKKAGADCSGKPVITKNKDNTTTIKQGVSTPVDIEDFGAAVGKGAKEGGYRCAKTGMGCGDDPKH